MPVPPFDINGNLPSGIQWASWTEFIRCFDTNQQRHRLITGLQEAAELLRRAGCRDIYVGGSLVTNKELPSDFDACWDGEGISLIFLHHLEPALVGTFSEQRARFGGELSFARSVISESGKTFLDFLQSDKYGNPKGVIGIRLTDL
jgi:hypothetical protein